MGGQSQGTRAQQGFTFTIAIVALQVGCLTLIIILGALIVGLWLDRTLDTLPIFLIIFLVGSMPLTWVAVFFVVNRAKKRMKLDPAMQDNIIIQEDYDSDRS